MDTLTLQLPTHWASALINSDCTGFDDAEQRQFDKFSKHMSKQYLSWHCVDVCDESPYFMRYHDAEPYGVLACDVIEMLFHVAPANQKVA